MGLNHYFSNDAEKRAKFIFNLIAPVYGKLDKAVEAGFKKSIDELDEKIILKNKSVLDIGTGTGAWASLFSQRGAINVIGVDFSEKMLMQAKEAHKELKFLYGDAKNLSGIQADSFDIVTASFVLHGTNREVRRKILSEMSRVSKQFVVIHDFVGKTPFGIKVLEFLERSDFINFKKTFSEEMKEFFNNTYIIDVGGGSGLYVGSND